MNRRIVLRVLPILVLLLAAQALGAAGPAPAGHKVIARVWRGRTLAAKADAYQKYLDADGIERLLAVPGNRGVDVLRREDGKETEFVVISFWESLDAVRKFAGERYEKAVILDRDREFLLSVEESVRHFEVVREERK
jgi:heme-degrading monooxygenase HmoA